MSRHHEELAEYNETMREVQELRAEVEWLKADKAGWEVEGFIDRLTRRDDTNSERLVLEAISHLRGFSRDCDAMREDNQELRAEVERLRAENEQLRTALQFYADDCGHTGTIARAALEPEAMTPDDRNTEGDKTHDWFVPDFIGYECCRKCGIVRRRDHQHKPCRGIVKIGLRAALEPKP